MGCQYSALGSLAWLRYGHPTSFPWFQGQIGIQTHAPWPCSDLISDKGICYTSQFQKKERRCKRDGCSHDTDTLQGLCCPQTVPNLEESYNEMLSERIDSAVPPRLPRYGRKNKQGSSLRQKNPSYELVWKNKDTKGYSWASYWKD